MAENKEPVIGRNATTLASHPYHPNEYGKIVEVILSTGQYVLEVENCSHGKSQIAAMPQELKFESLKNQSMTTQTGDVKPKNTWGGAREGAGRPRGKANFDTIQRAAIRKEFEDRIHNNVHVLLNAALTKALGETYLIKKVTERDSKGKVTRVYHETVTDPQVVIEYLDGELEGHTSLNEESEDEYYYMSTKPVDMFAVKELYDRAFGKPKATVEESGEKKLIIETRRHKG